VYPPKAGPLSAPPFFARVLATRSPGVRNDAVADGPFLYVPCRWRTTATPAMAIRRASARSIPSRDSAGAAWREA